MRMAVTFVWRHPFSTVYLSRKKKRSVADVASVTRPVPHGTDLPVPAVPQPPEDCQQDTEEETILMKLSYSEPATSSVTVFG